MKFILITKLSDPEELDSMGLPVYEEIVIPRDKVILSKEYIKTKSQNGATWDDLDLTVNELAAYQAFLKGKSGKKLLPDPAVISGEYRYFVLQSETGVKFEISDHEYHKLSDILLSGQEG